MSPRDAFDVPLDDPILREELALLADVMVAANETPGAIDPRDVDRLLGIRRRAFAAAHETSPER
jgi:hypothetical protein